MGALAGKVAVVTGASRGIGKGIAIELGAASATVYLTGRSTAATGPLPGTIGETADEVTALGGTGIAVRCDHHNDAEVEAVFSRVRDEQGRIDVLVNNVYSAPALARWLGKSFWEIPIDAWDEIINIGARSHYVAARFAAPLMIEQGAGVIANISSSGAVEYAHTVTYGVGKAALDKMTADMAHELRPHNVAVVSIWPGMVRTELVMAGATTSDAGRPVLNLPGGHEFDLGRAESPRFAGRAVAALATDAGVLERSGRAFTTRDLAAAYGFTDLPL